MVPTIKSMMRFQGAEFSQPSSILSANIVSRQPRVSGLVSYPSHLPGDPFIWEMPRIDTIAFIITVGTSTGHNRERKKLKQKTLRIVPQRSSPRCGFKRPNTRNLVGWSFSLQILLCPSRVLAFSLAIRSISQVNGIIAFILLLGQPRQPLWRY